MARIVDPEFEKAFSRGYKLVTVSVLYHMPDHRSLLNEFVWQTLDLTPKYPRVQKFLDYWRREIEAVIREVTIAEVEPLAARRISTVKSVLTLN